MTFWTWLDPRSLEVNLMAVGGAIDARFCERWKRQQPDSSQWWCPMSARLFFDAHSSFTFLGPDCEWTSLADAAISGRKKETAERKKRASRSWGSAVFSLSPVWVNNAAPPPPPPLAFVAVLLWVVLLSLASLVWFLWSGTAFHSWEEMLCPPSFGWCCVPTLLFGVVLFFVQGSSTTQRRRRRKTRTPKKDMNAAPPKRRGDHFLLHVTP